MSGGSFFVEHNGQWVATGIVSVGDSRCDVEKHMLYTRISDFTDWIKSVVSENPST